MGVIDMALTGRDPKTNKHGRTPTADWTDVPDRPYDGPSPDLPRLSGRRKWREQVVSWWDEVRVMPHCVLWTATDWRFALETAYMKQQFWVELDDGDMKTTTATEIRRREDQMGTTGEARRKLRIRYVDPTLPTGAGREADYDQPVVEDIAVAGGASTVTSLDSRRARLVG
jgi:hypothetical protein